MELVQKYKDKVRLLRSIYYPKKGQPSPSGGNNPFPPAGGYNAPSLTSPPPLAVPPKRRRGRPRKDGSQDGLLGFHVCISRPGVRLFLAVVGEIVMEYSQGRNIRCCRTLLRHLPACRQVPCIFIHKQALWCIRIYYFYYLFMIYMHLL